VERVAGRGMRSGGRQAGAGMLRLRRQNGAANIRQPGQASSPTVEVMARGAQARGLARYFRLNGVAVRLVCLAANSYPPPDIPPATVLAAALSCRRRHEGARRHARKSSRLPRDYLPDRWLTLR